MANKPKKIFYGWWIVLVSFIAMSMSGAPFVFASFGIFINPLSEEFGWARAELSTSLSFLMFSIALSMPVAGRLIDQYGPKRILVISVTSFGCMLSLIPLIISEIWHLSILFALIGVFAAGAAHVGYVAIASSWFNLKRGLAIGITISGIGLGYAYVPKLVQWIIDFDGWRLAYYSLSALVLFVSLPLIILVLRENPAQMGLFPDGKSTAVNPKATDSNQGLYPKEIFTSREYWLLAATIFCLSFALYGLMVHLVPMLTDEGVSSSFSTTIASVLGLSVLAGRPLAGYLVDHFFGPRIGLAFFMLSAIGMGLWAFGDVTSIAIVAAILIGLSLGAEIDLIGYLGTIYFGLRSFGMAFGSLISIGVFGHALGAVIYGAVYDHTGSYELILFVSFFISLIPVICMMLFGPYPETSKEHTAGDATGEPAY